MWPPQRLAKDLALNLPLQIHLQHFKTVSRDAFQSGNSDDNNTNDNSNDSSDNNDENDEPEHSENPEDCIVSRWGDEFLKSWPWLIYDTQTDTATSRYRERRVYSPFLINLLM